MFFLILLNLDCISIGAILPSRGFAISLRDLKIECDELQETGGLDDFLLNQIMSFRRSGIIAEYLVIHSLLPEVVLFFSKYLN